MERRLGAGGCVLEIVEKVAVKRRRMNLHAEVRHARKLNSEALAAQAERKKLSGETLSDDINGSIQGKRPK